MLLALLRLVAGLGGRDIVLVLLADIIINGSAPILSLEVGFFRMGSSPLSMDAVGVKLLGGGMAAPPFARGGGVPGTERGALPLGGGGGVAGFASVFSAPGFLFTHRFRSGSKTNWLASPSLALTATGPSSFLLPPNQREKNPLAAL